MTSYPRRLIEVDLPIKRISVHARREKSIRHGHISTLHIWWARRPLAACRAVICASLWPDPADPLCPVAFREAAAKEVVAFAGKITRQIELQKSADPATLARWMVVAGQIRASEKHGLGELGALKSGPVVFDPANDAHMNALRFLLLDFIADFANWDNSTVPEYLETARALTQAAHEALGGEPGTRPLVVDPFAGGGSIPLEALRVGADAFASDLNPVAVLLNTALFGKGTTEELLHAFDRAEFVLRDRLSKGWGTIYRSGKGDGTTFALFWTRTLVCEGPACGIEIPLIRDAVISNRSSQKMSFSRLRGEIVLENTTPGSKAGLRPKLEIGTLDRMAPDAHTCGGGAATCPRCNYTMKQGPVAAQAVRQGFGHRLIALGVFDGERKTYRLPTANEESVLAVQNEVGPSERTGTHFGLTINPKRPSPSARGMSAVTRYGYGTFGTLFFPRQVRFIEEFGQLCREYSAGAPEHLREPVLLLLSLVVDRTACFINTFCRWAPKGEHPVPPFGKNGFPMIWDFVEPNPLAASSGSIQGAFDWVRRTLEHVLKSRTSAATVVQADARALPLPDDAVDALITDPPYYDSYPYADLSDFFSPILRTTLGDTPYARNFDSMGSPKEAELVLQPSRVVNGAARDHRHYESGMTEALTRAAAVVRPHAIGVVVFANKTTSGWEALLSSICDASWRVTASWPLQTERESRSQNEARLQSSVHLVIRPREDSSSVGDWRDVLQELPKRIHEWMPRLASEGVVGADAIFACLGPALEIFSRYSRVEKASGEAVPLREYLENVWAAVSKEALSMIFRGADATGFEEDARLTAMWLWTIGAGGTENGKAAVATEGDDDVEDDEDESPKSKRPIKGAGFSLEYDAARKIAQGLGAHLEKLEHVVEVKGSAARMLAVAERTRYLFGKQEDDSPMAKKKKNEKSVQADLFGALEAAEAESGGDGWGDKTTPPAGKTALDRVHQAMILFAAGRGEALRRFLVDDGSGREERFWRLAQALSALYPGGSEEKRWVDGVLARKKGLGL